MLAWSAVCCAPPPVPPLLRASRMRLAVARVSSTSDASDAISAALDVLTACVLSTAARPCATRVVWTSEGMPPWNGANPKR
jgi:hypothetical protein